VKKLNKNYLKKTRESLMISKAELARKANISPITISRIENGMPCRMETKRKILLALGLNISDKNKVFH
jgi:DNA-binding XRE family transcriptional regulator